MGDAFEGWYVEEIPPKVTYDWLLYRHYAKLVPASITNAFGLFHQGHLRGVCTLGVPPNYMLNQGRGLFRGTLEVETLELNRLCVADDIPENGLSWFVARVLNSLEGPMVLVSYADQNWNHHGYIYQATNWVYWGETGRKTKYVDKETGEHVHGRTIRHQNKTGSTKDHAIQEKYWTSQQEPKHRYVYFIGNKREKRMMMKRFAHEVLPYPKGDNERYDAKPVPGDKGLLGRMRSARRT